jgi:hypothetical protein
MMSALAFEFREHTKSRIDARRKESGKKEFYTTAT